MKSEVIEGSTKGTKIINVNVEEKPTGEITIGAGAGTEGGTLGFSVSENNFLGKGIKLGTALRLTEDTIKGSFQLLIQISIILVNLYQLVLREQI